jgi:hypothetical protein
MHSINNAAVLNRVLYLFIYKSWIGDSTEDEATDQDNDLGKELNHELVSNVHAIGQVATVSSIDNIFYLQMLPTCIEEEKRSEEETTSKSAM